MQITREVYELEGFYKDSKIYLKKIQKLLLHIDNINLEMSFCGKSITVSIYGDWELVLKVREILFEKEEK